MLLLETVFDIIVELTVFVGRFDARSLKPVLSKVASQDLSVEEFTAACKGSLFDFRHESTKEDGFWFDWLADCGDGFNSSYQVSRLLAQPSIQVTSEMSNLPTKLPRGKVLLIGGDLCYPGPSEFNFENRFFRVFEDAMPPPPSFRKSAIAIKKPRFPVKGWRSDECFNCAENDRIESYKGPIAFCIPGNHDW